MRAFIAMSGVAAERQQGRANIVAGGDCRLRIAVVIAEQVAAEVEAWLPGAAVDETVEAEQIRLKVIEVLKQIDPMTAASFEAFKKAPGSESI